MPMPGILSPLAAVLALHTHASAEIPPRILANEIQVRLQFEKAPDRECGVVRWDGIGIEGACGAIAWSELKPSCALSTLQQLTGKDDPAVRLDAAVIALSIDPKGSGATRAIDWARQAGADDAAIARIKSDAERLAKDRAAHLRAAAQARLARLTPEAGSFPRQPLKALHSHDVEAVSDATVEAARALLARAGGGGTLHRAEAHVALLGEGAEQGLAETAVILDRIVKDWVKRINETGVAVSDQGIVPVILPADRDRWRLLVQAAFEGDAARFPDSVTVYPKTGLPETHRPIVIVNPAGDSARVRYHAAVGLARAVLHCTGTPTRPPAWLNEGLPRVMAASAVPTAGMDNELRKRGLAALRSGANFDAVLAAGYGEGIWERDPELAHSLAYLFSAWLVEQNLGRTMQYAHGPRIAESEPERFARVMGVSIRDAQSRAVRWYQVND